MCAAPFDSSTTHWKSVSVAAEETQDSSTRVSGAGAECCLFVPARCASAILGGAASALASGGGAGERPGLLRRRMFGRRRFGRGRGGPASGGGATAAAAARRHCRESGDGSSDSVVLKSLSKSSSQPDISLRHLREDEEDSGFCGERGKGTLFFPSRVIKCD